MFQYETKILEMSRQCATGLQRNRMYGQVLAGLGQDRALLSLLCRIEHSHSTTAGDVFIMCVIIIGQAKNLIYYTVVNKNSKYFVSCSA
jgi:hypothetical protein